MLDMHCTTILSAIGSAASLNIGIGFVSRTLLKQYLAFEHQQAQPGAKPNTLLSFTADIYMNIEPAINDRLARTLQHH